MKKETREIFKVLAIGLAVMVVLPLSYRIWSSFHAHPVESRQQAADSFAKMSEERAVRLMLTPPAKWTEAERRLEPKIHAWLEANAKTVFPWEWTEEARKKDPSGYRKLWAGLFSGQKRELERMLKSERKELKSYERGFETMQASHAHRTNQIARVMEHVSTNSFPVVGKVERLSKGRFWGWNMTIEEVKFGKREDFYGRENGWLAAERRTAERERLAMLECDSARKMSQARIEALKGLVSKVARLEGSRDFDDGRCLLETCRIIKGANALYGD